MLFEGGQLAICEESVECSCNEERGEHIDDLHLFHTSLSAMNMVWRLAVAADEFSAPLANDDHHEC